MTFTFLMMMIFSFAISRRGSVRSEHISAWGTPWAERWWLVRFEDFTHPTGRLLVLHYLMAVFAVGGRGWGGFAKPRSCSDRTCSRRRSTFNRGFPLVQPRPPVAGDRKTVTSVRLEGGGKMRGSTGVSFSQRRALVSIALILPVPYRKGAGSVQISID